MSRGFIITLFCIAAIGCKRNNPQVDDTFDKEAMLTNFASNVVEPAYQQWVDDALELKSATQQFTEGQSQGNLESLRAAFINAHESWNQCAVYEIGHAAELSLRLKINTFPADTEQIEQNIANGGYNLEEAQNADAKGFAAIDYVLYANQDSLFTDSKRANYIFDNADYIYRLAKGVQHAWEANKNEFTSNTSSSAGSSISNLVNEINFEFELLKNARVGIPLGKKTLGETQVDKLEGFYSGQSNAFAISNLIGIKNAFTGGTGLGLDDYLNDLDAKKDDQLLSVAIIELFNEIETGLNDITLRSTIEDSPADLEPLYNDIEQLVVLLKTDMPSQLGVQITYQDNDGD